MQEIRGGRNQIQLGMDQGRVYGGGDTEEKIEC